MNKNLLLRPFLLALFVLSFAAATNAQDKHFSQFKNSPLNLGPALTGVYKGDMRFIGNYRSQWNGNSNGDVADYLTFSGAFDMNFFSTKLKNSLFGAGIVLNYDKAGYSHLKSSHLGLNGSYTHQLNQKNFLTLGLQVGFAQRRFSMDDLSFDQQFNGDIYDASLATGENFDEMAVFLSDFSIGLNYHWQKPASLLNRKRSKLDIGAALFHVNEPTQSYYTDSDVVLPARLSIYGIGTIQLTKRLDLLALATVQKQMPHTETLVGLAGKFFIDQTITKELALQLGLSMRLGDAWIPNIEVYYKQWQVGFSYDINFSDFDTATTGLGGPELSVIYVISKVQPLELFKVCPIY